MVETEWRFIFECAAYEDIRNQYEKNLKVGNIIEIFEEARLHITSGFLIKIHSWRNDVEKILKIS